MIFSRYHLTHSRANKLGSIIPEYKNANRFNNENACESNKR